MTSSDYSSTSNLASEYDVIIVGGGTAGLVLATRLSEEPQLNVLVLEAGENHANNPSVLTPGLSSTLMDNPQHDWGFESVSQQALGGRTMMHNRGKGLGGTSAFNRNMMTFPSKSSLDTWSSLGSEGWNFDSMSPYLKKFHTFHEPSKEVSDALGLDYMDESLHGKSGPIQVTFGEFHEDFTKSWAETFKTLGYKAKVDPITGCAMGGHNAPGTIDHETMTRSHSGVAYLTPDALQRSNLRIVTEALVESVVLKTENGIVTAEGVCFTDKSGESKTVRGKEVIICAGVIQSPQILELSGIGSSSLLKSLGITPIIDNPHVGENLQDHAVVGISFESTIPTFDSFRDPKVIGAAFAEYQAKRRGPMATATYCAAFMPSIEPLSEDKKDDLKELLREHLKYESLAFPAEKLQYEEIRKIIEDPEQSSIQFLMAPVQLNFSQCPAEISAEARLHDYFTIWASLSHPFSRGSVHINSASPTAKPTVDPNYYSHPLDAELVARHLQYISTIISTEPLKSLVKKDGLRIPNNFKLDTIDDAKDLLQYGNTTYHPCGTCAMMPKDLGGVVDERLRVYGVKGLRVVDASIFPLIPRGNIVSCVYATAEKAADLIKEDFGIRGRH